MRRCRLSPCLLRADGSRSLPSSSSRRLVYDRCLCLIVAGPTSRRGRTTEYTYPLQAGFVDQSALLFSTYAAHQRRINEQKRKNTEYTFPRKPSPPCCYPRSPPTEMDLNSSATAVSSSVDSAGGSSNKTRSFTAEQLMSSHHEAARTLNDPKLLSIDQYSAALLQQRTTTTPAISSSPAVAVELIRSFSFNSLKEVTCCFLDKNQDDVVRIILENCKKDVWKNGELSCLVEEYFGINSLEPLHKFTMTLDKCLNEVRERQLMAPLRCFEEEEYEAEKGDGEYACRTTTLEQLRNLIKAAGGLFREQLQSVYRQQLSMMEKLERRKQKVDKKLKSIKTWRKVSTITFASTFAAVLVGSVVAAAMAAPPVAAALAAAASVPVGSMGKWFNSLWKKYEDALKGEKELISAMKWGTRIIIAIKDQLASIPHVVEQLEIQIDAILVAADSALGDEEAVKIGIGEIKTKLGDFMNSIEDLGKQVDMCTGKVTEARTVVLQKVMIQ